MARRTKMGLTLNQEVKRLFDANLVYTKEDSEFVTLGDLLNSSRDDKLNYIAGKVLEGWYGDIVVRETILGDLHNEVNEKVLETLNELSKISVNRIKNTRYNEEA